MQVYLPIHQAACRQEIFDGVDAFGFNDKSVIGYIKHLDDAGRADVSFCNTGIETVTAKIIEAVHIQLAADELMQESLRIFVLEYLDGETKLPVHLFVHSFHQHQRDFFMRNSLYNRILKYMRKRTMSDVMQQDSCLYGFCFTVEDKIAFGG